MKIVSWNVNSLNVRLPHLESWLQSFAPDVVGLQETKMEDVKFPAEVLQALGYGCVFMGQKTYNGVAIVSRMPLVDVQLGIPGFEHEQKRAIAATINGVRIINLYVVNGQDIGTDKYAFKLEWLAAVHGWLKAELASHEKVVVVGDFNIAPDDRDVHNAEVWNEGHILTSRLERQAYEGILSLGLSDAFRLHHDEAGLYSWWDYRQAAFRRDMGLRIDLTLVSDALKPLVVAAGIDKEPRGWERPSDHAPAWVEVAV